MLKIKKLLTLSAGLLLAFVSLGLLISVVACSDSSKKSAGGDIAPVSDKAHPGYIGGAACTACHQTQHDSWVGSHHDKAMMLASEQSVLGDFNDAAFEHFGVKSRFFKKDGRFYVNTDGPDGKNADFEIKYTFGVTPLQQYLIEFPGGKVQALTVAWDTRKKEDGGQRWYHLYPDEATPAGDALHWTGPNFTWNHMCAECHSTDLQKNYDAQTQTYHTTWSEINVSCEACHGPGKDHADWAAQYKVNPKTDKGDMGLAVRLKDETRVWVMDAETGIAKRRTPLKDDTLINACARCHSRRSQIADGPDTGTPMLDHYMPSYLTEGLYFPDGQIQDEVYVWGSFQQSKMHMAGVTCVDCHDPHTASVPTKSNDLCAKCHLPSKFDVYEHYHHPPDSPGSQCINCHMPHRTYMGVDDRRDHSLRIPRPDLSLTLGTPNACNQCHTEQTVQWAADAAALWWGVDVDRPVHYGEVFYAARENQPGTDKALLEILRDEKRPPIVRGTAVMYLSRFPTRAAAEGILEALTSEVPLIRLAATDMLGNMPADQRLIPALMLLEDPLRSIRIEAAEALVDVPENMIPSDGQSKVKAGIEAYKQAQLVSADTAAANMNLGSLAYRMGDMPQAIAQYQRVLSIDPSFFPAYANLATIYSEQGDPDNALKLVEDGLAHLPNQPDLFYTRAMIHIRKRDYASAIADLGKAYARAPERTDLAYAYALALHDTGNPPRAIDVLEKAYAIAPNNPQILMALSNYKAELGDVVTALRYAKEAQKIMPEDPGVALYLRRLEAAQP